MFQNFFFHKKKSVHNCVKVIFNLNAARHKLHHGELLFILISFFMLRMKHNDALANANAFNADAHKDLDHYEMILYSKCITIPLLCPTVFNLLV